MPRIDLPSGGWADIKDADDIKNREMRALLRSDITDAVGMQDELQAAFIRAWSFDLPIPSEAKTSLDELSAKDGFALMKAVDEAAQPLIDVITGDTGRPDDPLADNGN